MNSQSGRLRTWGQVLHSVTLHGSKTCDTDAGGCGRFCPVQSFVYVPAPWCFVVRLAWERVRESPDAIRGTLAAIQEVCLSLLPRITSPVVTNPDRAAHSRRLLYTLLLSHAPSLV